MKIFKNYLPVVVLTLLFTGCTAVKGIFKAGMIWGIFLVIGVIALIFYLISRAGKK